MGLRIAFQMEPLEQSDRVKSTSFRLLTEAARRGHALFHYTVDQLSFREGRVVAQGSAVSGKDYALGEACALDLAEMDVVMMRQDPPFDMHYLTATWLLELLPKRVRVINHPAEVRNYPEKIMPLLFPHLVPATLITQQLTEVRAFHREHKDIIVKPLYAFGGRGVFRLKEGDSNLEPVVELLQERYQLPFIVQKYVPEVKEGDKRIVLFGGKVVGAFWRRPVGDDHRANLRVGGDLQPAELTVRDHEICEALSPLLKEKGLFLTGIDVIGPYLTEVNVTSPMGLVQLDALYGTDTAKLFWDMLEATL